MRAHLTHLPAVCVCVCVFCVTWHVYFQIMHLLWKKHVSAPPVCYATNHRAASPPTNPPITVEVCSYLGSLLASLALCFVLLSLMEKFPFRGRRGRVDGFLWQPLPLLRRVWKRLFERFCGTKLPFCLYGQRSGASSCPFRETPPRQP